LDQPAASTDASTRFDDWHAIQTLLVTYTELVDASRWAEAAALFEHGTYRHEYGPSGQSQIVTHTGTQEVQAYMARTPVFPDGTPRTRHTLTNINIQLDGDAATARSYLTVLQQTAELPLQPIATGHYVDRFERVDGKWRFADRLITGFMVGDLSQHGKNTSKAEPAAAG
jgi:3-phenylpropionate/cinnamic acid dioxygenase small subunit